jgi:hypothetical protein
MLRSDYSVNDLTTIVVKARNEKHSTEAWDSLKRHPGITPEILYSVQDARNLPYAIRSECYEMLLKRNDTSAEILKNAIINCVDNSQKIVGLEKLRLHPGLNLDFILDIMNQLGCCYEILDTCWIILAEESRKNDDPSPLIQYYEHGRILDWKERILSIAITFHHLPFSVYKEIICSHDNLELITLAFNALKIRTEIPQKLLYNIARFCKIQEIREEAFRLAKSYPTQNIVLCSLLSRQTKDESVAIGTWELVLNHPNLDIGWILLTAQDAVNQNVKKRAQTLLRTPRYAAIIKKIN